MSNDTTRPVFDEDQLLGFLKKHSIPERRAKQIKQAIFKESLLSFDEISTLPKELKAQLSAEFHICSLSLEQLHESNESTKFLFRLPDGNLIETVLMFHRHQKKDTGSQRKILRSRTNPEISHETHKLNRITICISSQVGCAVGCIFCVTGKLGFKKNLTAAQMIEQILYANAYIKNKFGKKEDNSLRKVRNVVFMGMGEPLLNYEHMKKAIELMLDQHALSLSKRHITVSTSGVASAMEKMIDEKVDVMLALSLHAPNQELRQELIPMIAKRRPLDELMRVVDRYVKETGKRIFYEYIMIKDKTDTQDIAHQLGHLLQKRHAHVNLIPYNENPAMPDLVTSDYDQILSFKKLVEGYGVTCTVRDTLGRDVKGACGQLGYEKVKENISDEDVKNISKKPE